jgi:hypothetical protein
MDQRRHSNHRGRYSRQDSRTKSLDLRTVVHVPEWLPVLPLPKASVLDDFSIATKHSPHSDDHATVASVSPVSLSGYGAPSYETSPITSPIPSYHSHGFSHSTDSLPITKVSDPIPTFRMTDYAFGISCDYCVPVDREQYARFKTTLDPRAYINNTSVDFSVGEHFIVETFFVSSPRFAMINIFGCEVHFRHYAPSQITPQFSINTISLYEERYSLPSKMRIDVPRGAFVCILKLNTSKKSIRYSEFDYLSRFDINFM